MKLRIKAAILLTAALLTFAGFSLIASSGADDIVKVGHKAGYEIIANYVAKANAASHHSF